MMSNENQLLKLAELCMPHALQRLGQLKKDDTKLVHYTSAYAAIEIISKEKVWMRSASVMNDFSEIDHGQKCLSGSWSDENVGG